jgi:hypothetical protein
MRIRITPEAQAQLEVQGPRAGSRPTPPGDLTSDLEAEAPW